MNKLTRRDFLRTSGLFAALLALPSFVKASARQVNAFAEEAAHVIATYGDMDGYYSQPGGGQTRWMFWACEACGYKDNYFESCKCEGCGKCWEDVTVDGRSGWGLPCLGHCDEG